MNELAKITKSEARILVERIRSHINDARALVLELYERQGWEALGYESWRECVVAEFEHSQRHLYRLLDAAKVEKNLSQVPENQQSCCPIGQLPESILRPLTKLKPEQQREAWSIASRITPSPTAAQVEQIAKTIERAITQAIEDTRSEPVQIKKNGEKRPPPDTRWIEFFGAIGQLLRIDPFDSENILNRYVELHDDPQTVSQDLDQCKAAIDRIRKITEEFLRRFPNV